MPSIASHSTDTSDRPWDGPANEARLRTGEDEAYYRRAYAWVDPDGDPTTKSAYRFIHHEVDSDGNIGPANIRACQTAIAVLNGARGGTTIPEADRRGVWEHLARHLRDAGLEPPELRSHLPRETRTYPVAELRVEPPSDGGPRRIVGYAGVFGVLSEDLGGFREVVDPGFFDAVLGDDVRALYNHDPNMVLGRTRSGTLHLEVDERGLRFVATPPDTGYARDLLQLIERGDVNQASFSWRITEDRWETREDGTLIRRLVRAGRLYDVGPVTFPAYPDTQVGLRAMGIPDIPAGIRGASVPAADDDRWRAQLDIKRRRIELLFYGG